MMDALKALAKQPYWVIALLLGALFIAFPYVTIGNYLTTARPAGIFIPIGVLLLILSAWAFWHTLPNRTASASDGGLDLTRVKENNGVMSTAVNGCEIRIVEGRVEDCAPKVGAAIVLPCNEYFDDRCAGDTRSAFGRVCGSRVRGSS